MTTKRRLTFLTLTAILAAGLSACSDTPVRPEAKTARCFAERLPNGGESISEVPFVCREAGLKGTLAEIKDAGFYLESMAFVSAQNTSETQSVTIVIRRID